MEDYKIRYEETQKEKLFFKVKGENKTNEVLNEIVPLLLNEFKDLKDKQILKVGACFNYGNLLKKYNDKVDLILREVEGKFNNEETRTTIYLNISKYSVYVKVRVMFKGCGDGFGHYDNNKYIFDIKDLYLNDFNVFNRFEEINPIEQYNNYKECLRLKEVLEEKEGKLKPYCLREMLR